MEENSTLHIKLRDSFMFFFFSFIKKLGITINI